MPRDVVHAETGEFHVKVGWAPDRYVQLGVETEDGRSMLQTMFAGRLAEVADAVRTLVDVRSWATPEDLGAALIDELDRVWGATIVHGQVNGAEFSSVTPSSDAHKGVWVSSLSRSGCNRLIRVLRRARDSAFGADA